MDNYFGCNLIIDTEECAPEIVTELTGVSHSKIVLKGTSFRTAIGELIHEKANESNLWILESGKIHEADNFYANEGISAVLSVLKQNSEAFQEALKRFPKRHMLVYSYYYEYNPYFILTKELVSSLHEFGIDIEFDLYFLRDES